ncbi:MAG: putative glycosyltransferase EpsH [Chlamydiae bacterium]|nr:putative glycosyltransferase EpsH [Chlamydiota bacterium]
MISVTILTKNSPKYLQEVLSALKSFDEVVIYDNGSTDETLSIAEKFSNVTIYKEKFVGFGPTHNNASAVAKHDWILSVDSDEVVTPEMANEILQTPLDEDCVYSFPRNNFFNGKFIKWCGWYPDRRVRLYNRKHTHFSDAQVHEGVVIDNLKHISLKGPLKHYSYASIAEFLEKMQLYSDLFAKQNVGRKSSSLLKAISHGVIAFLKSYLLKRGFLGGYEGFVISLYNGHTAYYKYLKLHEANKKLK